jgi:2-polyprenyl-3-methyl-5-hydroxy-6-metoxy-1,4-benzoquinol methylase
MDRKSHWDTIYSAKAPNELGWHQAHPELSLRLIEASDIGKDEPIIDIGGGASLLVDQLAALGFRRVTVLDISAAAIAAARVRLGEQAGEVHWLTEDITRFEPKEKYGLWHDRAVFHFLTGAADRQAYLDTAEQALSPGSQMIIATFALNGPDQCSGLPIIRYSPDSLAREIGKHFELLESYGETHVTPGGGKQRFNYCRFRRVNSY